VTATDAPLVGSANRIVDVRTGTITTWAELAATPVPAPAAVVVDSSFAALGAVKTHAQSGAEFLVVAAGRMEANLGRPRTAGSGC